MSRLTTHAILSGLLATTMLTGCAGMNRTQQGALLGSGLGAGLGAVIGHQSGHGEIGALAGALAGGLGGALVGNSHDEKEERDAALSYAHHVEQQRVADLRAVTNFDVIRLTQAGLSDNLIVQKIRTDGGRFNTSTDAIIQLKQSGVSEQVIQAMHDTSAKAYYR